MHSSKSIVRCISDIKIYVYAKRDTPGRETDVCLAYCTAAFSRSFLASIFHISDIAEVLFGKMKRDVIIYVSFVCVLKLFD